MKPLKKILRSLGAAEIFNLKENINFTNTFIVNTQIDFNKHQTLIHKAIAVWKQANPILQCTVSTDLATNTFYFQSTSENLDNVFFLWSKTESVWTSVSNFEVFKAFKFQQELLWRLVFLRLKSNKYCLIFTANHSVYDGHSGYQSMLSLLHTIDILSKGNEPELKIENILPCVEDITNSRAKAVSLTKIGTGLRKSLAPKPMFTNSLNEERPFWNERFDDVFVEDDENRLFIGLKDLKDQCDKSGTFEIMFEVEKTLAEGLLNKCRLCRLKMNGCINLLIIIAMKKAFDLYSVNSLDKMIYFNSISLRNYLSLDELKNKTELGYVSNAVYKEYHMNKNWRDVSKVLENFWNLSFEESHEFHTRLNSDEHFLREKWLEPDSNQLHFHYFLSNLGVKQPFELSYKEETPLITVVEHYKFSNLFEKKFKGILFVSTSTVNKTMFWSLLFNAKLVSYEFGQFFKLTLKNLIHELLEVNENY